MPFALPVEICLNMASCKALKNHSTHVLSRVCWKLANISEDFIPIEHAQA